MIKSSVQKILMVASKKIRAERIALELSQEEFANFDDIESITINIDWKKSQMWGNNPQAEAKQILKSGLHTYFNSCRVVGSGYDKESTAVAEALNQCNGVLKLLYTIKENNITEKNANLFGYGSGYGILPRIEKGVGVSCYNSIFNKVGFKFYTLSSGKTFDVYKIEKL
jgi:hypothetical protein